MKFIWNSIKSLSKFELCLWVGSTIAIVLPFFILHNTDYLTLCASIVGVTSLVFTAKGNVIGQILMVVFAVLYGIISYGFTYYGEMITYLGMTAPVAVASIVTWLKNSFNGNKAEVEINRIKSKEYIFMFALGIGVTVGFYFVLQAFNTANIILSTVSVFTSFIASYCELRRSEFYALGFVANDCILIALWVLATLENINYLAVTICFAVFLVNDLYGFISWSKIKKKQKEKINP